MTLSNRILLTSFAFAAAAHAATPQKAPSTRYSGLWTNSPFTTKPPPPAPEAAANPLEDYALGGVSPITGGYRVTILNKKDPEERIVINSTDGGSKFKILGITRKPGNHLGTAVRLAMGAVTGVVEYDEQLLVLKAPPAAQAPQGQQGQPGQPSQPGQPPQAPPGVDANGQPVAQPVQRQPRARVVPPPTTQGAPTATQGAPTATQGAPAAPQGAVNGQRQIPQPATQGRGGDRRQYRR